MRGISTNDAIEGVGRYPGVRGGREGLSGNPFGRGAGLRLGDGTHWGPAREVSAGAGYWSQNSAVQVLHFPGNKPGKLEVRWPGRPPVVYNVPEGALEVRVPSTGPLSVKP